MIDYLKEINDFIRSKKLTRIEQKRLAKDFEAVLLRLRKREYKKGGFSMNKFDVPDRTREFYIYLEFYCLLGKTWAAVLKEFGINNFSEVVDLCPGYTPKVELALFYLNYKGKVILLDKSQDSMFELIKFMRLFNPQYKFVPKKIDILGGIKKQYRIVLANHVIDDMVVDYFAKKFKFSTTDIYEKEGACLQLWNKILEKKDTHLGEIAPVISRVFHGIVKNKGWLIMTCYKSYMEKLLDLDGATAFSRTLFNKVTADLCSDGFIEDKKITRKAFAKFHGHFGPKDCRILQKRF